MTQRPTAIDLEPEGLDVNRRIQSDQSDQGLIFESLHRPQAFNEVFDRRYDTIRSYLSRRSDENTADDLASHTFLRAFEIRSEFKGSTDGTATSWLYSIARGLLMHHYRSEGRHRRRLLRAQNLVDQDHSTDALDRIEEMIDASTTWPAVRDALRTCPDGDVDLLILTALEDLTNAEAAEVVGIPVGTVKSRLSRTKEKLRRILEASPDMEQGGWAR